ncbi:hypothetical protein CIPAW_06G012500 [Carya illinoinensis]|uniref:Uncharacterized protein n=1 Tax=Carya illinoinensis TaxID=32201 RepID=A0A8T1Q664_CARIL|nr:hypothetical protein CIPAW_06G012500 [Carya illinoinensis]
MAKRKKPQTQRNLERERVRVPKTKHSVGGEEKQMRYILRLCVRMIKIRSSDQLTWTGGLAMRDCMHTHAVFLYLVKAGDHQIEIAGLENANCMHVCYLPLSISPCPSS